MGRIFALLALLALLSHCMESKQKNKIRRKSVKYVLNTIWSPRNPDSESSERSDHACRVQVNVKEKPAETELNSFNAPNTGNSDSGVSGKSESGGDGSSSSTTTRVPRTRMFRRESKKSNKILKNPSSAKSPSLMATKEPKSYSQSCDESSSTTNSSRTVTFATTSSNEEAPPEVQREVPMSLRGLTTSDSPASSKRSLYRTRRSHSSGPTNNGYIGKFAVKRVANVIPRNEEEDSEVNQPTKDYIGKAGSAELALTASRTQIIVSLDEESTKVCQEHTSPRRPSPRPNSPKGNLMSSASSLGSGTGRRRTEKSSSSKHGYRSSSRHKSSRSRSPRKDEVEIGKLIESLRNSSEDKAESQEEEEIEAKMHSIEIDPSVNPKTLIKELKSSFGEVKPKKVDPQELINQLKSSFGESEVREKRESSRRNRRSPRLDQGLEMLKDFDNCIPNNNIDEAL